MKQAIKERIEQIKNGQVPSGYKQTPVGVCPIDWEYKKLKKLIKIKHGQPQHRIETIDGIYPILATGGIIGRTNDFLCNKESVLIGRKGTINKPQYMDSPFWTVDTLFYTNILENNLAKYIYYLFLTINWKRYDESTGVPSLSAKGIENIKTIYTTNINEQKNIANVLTTWDNAVELQEKKIEKLQEKKKALMQKLLTPKSDWKEAKLGDICEISTGKLDANKMVEDGKYAFFTCSKEIYRINEYAYDCEALLMAGNGEIGDIKYYNGKFNAYQRTYVLTNFKLDIAYVMQYLLLNFDRTVCKGMQKSSMPYIKLGLLQEAEILYPKNLEQISKTLKVYDNKLDIENQLLEKYKEQRKALMQLLLTGIVRV